MAIQNRVFQFTQKHPPLVGPTTSDQDNIPLRVPSLSQLWQRGFPPISQLRLLAGHLCLDVLANTRNLCSLSIASLQNTHFRFNDSSSKVLACNQFPQRINFHSSPSFTLPLSTDYFNSNAFLKSTLFSISSYPSPNSEHSTTVTVY